MYKSKKSSVDLPMANAILGISFPLMVNSIVHTIYNLVDAFWVGKLGANQFAATTFVGPVLGVFIAIGMGLASAGTSIISQSLGKGDEKEASSYAYQLSLIGLVLAVLVALVGSPLSANIVDFMGANPDIRDFSIDYLSIMFLGFPGIILTNVISSQMQAQGNTRPLMISSIASGVANTILDPIFIFDTIPYVNLPGFGLGVKGAAIATIISQYLNLLIGLWILYSFSKLDISIKNNSPNKAQAKALIRVGVPAMIGQSSAAFGFVILNRFIAAYGTSTLAAYGVVNRVTDLLMQPAMAVGAGIPSLIGKAFGGKRLDRVKSCYKTSILISMVLSIVGAVIVYFNAEEAIGFFINKEDAHLILPEALEYVAYSLVIMPLMGLFSIYHGFFVGTGHTQYSMTMSFSRLWIIRLPMIWYFQNFTGLGSTGIWIAMTASNLIIVIYGWFIYTSGKWKIRKIE